MGFPGGTGGKEPTCQCRRHKRCWFNPWVRKIPGKGNDNPLQFLAWKIPWTEEPGRLHTVHGVARSQKRLKRLSTYTHNVVIWASQDGTSGKESAGQCRRLQRRKFDTWVGKIPSSRKWQPTSVFLPGKSHTQRSLVSYSPQAYKTSDMTEQLNRQARNVVIYLEKGKIYRKKLLEQKQFSKVCIHKVTIQKLQSYKPTTVI